MELVVKEAQLASRRTGLIYTGLAIFIGSAVGLMVTSLENPFFLLLAIGALFVVIATIASAEFGLLLFVFITYTRFSDIAIDQYGAPSVAKFFVVLLIIAILIRWALLGERPANWQVPAFLLFLYGFVGFLSLIYAEHSDPVVYTLTNYAKDSVIALVIVMLLKRGSTFRHVIWVLLAIAIFLGALSVFQYFTGTFTNDYGGFALAEWRNISGSMNGYRLTGPIHDANFFAQIMLVFIPIAVERMLHERRLLLRLLAILAGVLSTLTVIFTFSRGGFLATLVILAILFIMYPPRPVQLAILIGIGLGISTLIPSTYYDRILTLQELVPNQSGRIDVRTDISIQGRASQYLTGWEMFKQNPFFGIGLNNFSSLYPEYSKEIGLAPNTATRALHNHYLEVATETGIVGLTVFLSLIWYALRSVALVRKKFLEASQPDYAHLVSGLTVGFIGYMIAAAFVPTSFPRYFYLLLGIMYSLPAVAERVRKEAGGQGSRLERGR
jgi:O-antigen ligase